MGTDRKSCGQVFALVIVAVLTISGYAAVVQQNAPPPPPPPQDLSPRDRAALEKLRARPAWLFPATDCPADVMPGYDRDSGYVVGRCEGDLAGCAERCAADDGPDCYALALVLESRETETQSDEPVFEALYLRACRLGLATGCTNRAAGLTYRDPVTAASDACAARTFGETCSRDDAWGCTMYGFHLMSGRGVPKDLEQAARMFEKACGYDETFVACTKAKRLLKQIEDEGELQPESPD